MKIDVTYMRLLTALSVLFFVRPVWANGSDNQMTQPRPISLGVSGGDSTDATRLFCCGGTLGGLVTDGQQFYILSNNHVLAKSNFAAIGDDIVQPGLHDVGCQGIPQNVVADLTDFEPIRFFFFSNNSVDAALAAIRAGQVDTSGSILGIGQPDSTPIAPEIGMAVKKSGRTTGVTHGTIAAVNVTVSVGYPLGGRCGTPFNQTAIFTNQIRIVGSDNTLFSMGGDSGSVIVQDTDACPRPVGLLFAGGAIDTFANPITDVLDTFGMEFVGCP